MYAVRAEPGSGRYVVFHPALGALPLPFTSERMAQHFAWALNMAPDAMEEHEQPSRTLRDHWGRPA